MTQGKAFEIPKILVWRSYQEVRRNNGAPGCDGQTIKQFDENRDRNLYKIWNRLSSGSYFPPPVREKRIPKEDGTERILGIPTVSDRVAQGVVKQIVEAQAERIFLEDSYGYRPNRSAHQAIRRCAERCWGNKRWVVEIDIRKFFDQVRHDYILKALTHLKMQRWVILYCQRWLEAPVQEQKSSIILQKRTQGTPQGGVISPVLANLFLHYAFDRWIKRAYPSVKFERYADDIICHCQTMREAVEVRESIASRFQDLGLELNKEKSQIAYVGDFKRHNVKTEFTFLGYDFKIRTLKDPKGRLFRKCMPGASKKALKKITRTITEWKVHRSTVEKAEDFASRYNAILRGWIEYYGKFWYRNFSYRLWCTFQSRLIKWAKSKYRIGTKKAKRKLYLLKKEKPQLFAHWYLLRASNA